MIFAPRCRVIKYLYARRDIDSKSGCWLFTGEIIFGYGRAKINGKRERVHRLSFRTFVASIRKGFKVLHRCHTPRCFNPCHLYQGTSLQNSQDMVKAGRSLCGARNSMNRHPECRPHGERHGRSKLTELEVLELRRFRESDPLKWTFQALGNLHSISAYAAQAIVKRWTWRHLS